MDNIKRVINRQNSAMIDALLYITGSFEQIMGFDLDCSVTRSHSVNLLDI